MSVKKASHNVSTTTSESRDSGVYDFPDEITKKPKGATSAYAFFSHQHREDLKKSDEIKRGFGDVSKECAKLWKDMTPKDREPYRVLAAKDKERYNEEMKHYVPIEKKKRKKRVKDPNAPRRTISSFFLFCKDHRPLLNEKQPELKGKHLNVELGRQWNQLDPVAKAKYTEATEKDKKRYEQEMAEYKRNSSKRRRLEELNSVKDEDTSGDDEDDDDDV